MYTFTITYLEKIHNLRAQDSIQLKKLRNIVTQNVQAIMFILFPIIKRLRKLKHQFFIKIYLKFSKDVRALLIFFIEFHSRLTVICSESL